VERPGTGLTTYKSWRLRPGVVLDDVVALVTERVAPHYALLSDEVELGLERIDDDTVLAIQRWSSRRVRDAAMQGPAFESWWAAYQPALAAWDAALEYVDEWEGEDLLG
jgi:hypothetical protein